MEENKSKAKKPKHLVDNIIKKVRTPKQNKKQDNNKTALQKLKLLITIVNRRKAEFYADYLQSHFNINMQMSVLARGTADSVMLGVLGLEGNEKTVIFSVVNETQAQEALNELGEKFHTIRNGKGVAFTVPLSSVAGVALYRFLSDNRMAKKEDK